MAGRQRFKDERARHLEAIGSAPLPLPSERRSRPATYEPDLCDEAVDLAASAGLSTTEIAAHWAISHETLMEWANTHPELADALSRARTAAEAWWEEKARRALELRDNRFPAGAWAMVMKARFPGYADRVEVSHKIDVTSKLVLIDLRAAGLPGEQMVPGANPLIEGQVVGLAGSLTGDSSRIGDPQTPRGGAIDQEGDDGGRGENPVASATDGHPSPD